MSLVVIAGPAGVGKGTIVRKLLAESSDFILSVSATTRAPRPGEINGVDYHFVNMHEFEHMIAQNQLLEFAKVHGVNFYGTPVSELERANKLGKHLVLEIDLQGVRQVKERVPKCLSIFILPPDWETLEQRLRGRGTETEAEIQTRLSTARTELDSAGEFDHQVTNQDLDQAVAEVLSLVRTFERGS